LCESGRRIVGSHGENAGGAALRSVCTLLCPGGRRRNVGVVRVAGGGARGPSERARERESKSEVGRSMKEEEEEEEDEEGR